MRMNRYIWNTQILLQNPMEHNVYGHRTVVNEFSTEVVNGIISEIFCLHYITELDCSYENITHHSFSVQLLICD